MMQKLNTLITGGAGYIGVLLAEALLKDGHVVTIVDNFVYGCEPILGIVEHPNLHIIKRDIREADMDYLKGQDAIFHLAGISGIPGCKLCPDSAKRINQDATKRMVDNLSNDQFMVFASTTSLYGTGGQISDEKTHIETDSIYAETKYEAEKTIMDREHSISLRWPTVFGVSPRMRQGLIVNDFVYKAVYENVIVTYQGHSKRTFIHIRDTVQGYVFALNNREAMQGQIYNMGSESLNYSKLDVAHAIQDHVQVDIIETDFESTPDDARDFYVNFDKAKALNYTCKYTLDDGIRDLVKLYRFFDPFTFVKPI
jgi:nucleoside-diphosphate-sugar epimerase